MRWSRTKRRRWIKAAREIAVGILLMGAAAVLPYQQPAAFTWLTFPLGAAFSWAGVLRLRRTPHGALLRSGLCIAAALYAVWLCVSCVQTTWALSRLYGGLGRGLGATLLALAGVVMVVLGPLLVELLTRVRQKPRLLWWLLVVVLGVGIGTWEWQAASTGRRTRFEAPSRSALTFALDRRHISAADGRPVRSLVPALCASPASAVEATALVSVGEGKPRCLQGQTDAVLAQLARQVSQGSRVKVDWVSVAEPALLPRGALADVVRSLHLRPGLDGVCLQERCLAPWQLSAGRVFFADKPLPFAGGFRLGVSERRLALLFGSTSLPPASLTRIETTSWLIAQEGVRPLLSGRSVASDVTADGLRRGADAAQHFVIGAQDVDGGFRYHTNFFTAQSRGGTPNLPRHAGVLMVLCELGDSSPATRRAAELAAAHLAGFRRAVPGDRAVLARGRERSVSVGTLALGLAALVRCRGVVGPMHDALIAELTRSVLSLLREDGRFQPRLRVGDGQGLAGPTPLFAGGQAILALGLVEATLVDAPELADAIGLFSALERAMGYVAEAYWPAFARELFWLQENWHCVAASALLSTHGHRAYQDVCLDYARFKVRFILDEDAGGGAWAGAMGFGNLFPPHNGSTAGLAEALAAALSIARARGEEAGELEHGLRAALGFLSRQQLQRSTCFFCDPAAYGGFTAEQVGVDGRIDHTQHAWAALGHGLRALAL